MKRVNKWFAEVFLESFEPGEYHAQDGWLKPWQYKNLMELAERNQWKMISSKQWEVFKCNVNWTDGRDYDRGIVETKTKTVSIKVCRVSGFVTIDIDEKH